ncbi:hypothetical protein DFJ74DRAFT_746003 [Hyaloraphidium curvatum]|nr:hypothetical protein DFJ74DRAFT_746003 [Hyaloraphidium curvatum]
MEEESAPAEPLATFSPAEWAALFPAPLRADDLPAELVPLVAKAADERAAAPPLGPADVSAALADAPVSRRLLHLQGFLGRAVLPRFALLRLAQQAFYVFFAALVWIENDGRFGTRQLVAATVARVVAQVIWDWRVLAGRFSSPDDREIFLDNEAVAAGADGSVLAGIVRYRLLERAGGSWLLEHQARGVADSGRAVIVTGLLAESVALLIVLLASSCIPAYNLAAVVYNIFLLVTLDLSEVAAANTSPLRIAGLYRSAAYSFRSIGMSAVARGLSAAAAAADIHERILSGFADVEPQRPRAFGVPVTFGLVRTVVATLFTLGVGLWRVLRGAGVGVTIEMVCPTPGPAS